MFSEFSFAFILILFCTVLINCLKKSKRLQLLQLWRGEREGDRLGINIAHTTRGCYKLLANCYFQPLQLKFNTLFVVLLKNRND